MGCLLASPKYGLQTVRDFDIDRYTSGGVWYEVYRIDHWFEWGGTDAEAEYRLLADNRISVRNSMTSACCRVSLHGQARQIDDDEAMNSNGKLSVSFCSPCCSRCCEGDYYVLDVDYDRYALVGSRDRRFLWILSRTKSLDEDVVKQLKLKAINLGFDSNRLICTSTEQKKVNSSWY